MSAWAGIDEFVTVAQTRSFSRAGKRLGCSTSQVSREIASLEDRLGQRLFFRTTRQVSLTEAGEHFLVRCRRLIEDRDEALAAMQEQGERLQGQLRMTCSVAYGERFIVPVITQMICENPGLSVDLVLTDEIVDIVERGLDLAIRFGRLRDSRLVATRLASRTRRLCASPEYVARHGAPRRLEDLGQHVCLRGLTDAWIFRSEGQIYTHRAHGPFRCNSGAAVLAAALKGIGLCRLPDFYVLPHLESGRLVELLPEHRYEDEGVWAVYPDRRLPAKVKAVIERIQRELARRATPQEARVVNLPMLS